MWIIHFSVISITWRMRWLTDSELVSIYSSIYRSFTLFFFSWSNKSVTCTSITLSNDTRLSGCSEASDDRMQPLSSSSSFCSHGSSQVTLFHSHHSQEEERERKRNGTALNMLSWYHSSFHFAAMSGASNFFPLLVSLSACSVSFIQLAMCESTFLHVWSVHMSK